MSQQDRTLDRYQELMQINAASHVLRAARQVGIFTELRRGQRTAQQLAEALQLDPTGLDLLLDCLISMNVIERYQDDHALAPVMQLLCQYDADLGDPDWLRLTSKVRAHRSSESEDAASSIDRNYLNALSATQWVHTPAAMQAAEMLDIGSQQPSDSQRTADSQRSAALRILDLGCGSAVWSCAMAFRDSDATVLAVDDQAALAAARSTAQSIQLGDRFETLAAEPENADLPAAGFNLVLIAQRLHAATDQQRQRLLDQATDALAPGGRLVLIDLFRGPTKPRLSETIEALRIHVGTAEGRMQSAQELREQLLSRGLSDIQFTFIAASRINLGMIVANKQQA
jgi:ubiquinone/menaquinone biosynthesis C-methylase UbiE